jgi:hypothetical protein
MSLLPQVGASQSATSAVVEGGGVNPPPLTPQSQSITQLLVVAVVVRLVVGVLIVPLSLLVAVVVQPFLPHSAPQLWVPASILPVVFLLIGDLVHFWVQHRNLWSLSETQSS